MPCTEKYDQFIFSHLRISQIKQNKKNMQVGSMKPSEESVKGGISVGWVLV